MQKGFVVKKLGFITTNKVLAQSLATTVRDAPGLGFAPFLLLNPRQAALDAEMLHIDVAVVDIVDGATEEAAEVLPLCIKLREILPLCRVLLLVSQEDKTGKKMAIDAMRTKVADDFVFYDASLDYLFAKLASF